MRHPKIRTVASFEDHVKLAYLEKSDASPVHEEAAHVLADATQDMRGLMSAIERKPKARLQPWSLIFVEATHVSSRRNYLVGS